MEIMTLVELVEKLGEKEAMKVMVEQANWTELDFRFALALERGEITGDVIEVDRANRPT